MHPGVLQMMLLLLQLLLFPGPAAVFFVGGSSSSAQPPPVAPGPAAFPEPSVGMGEFAVAGIDESDVAAIEAAFEEADGADDQAD